ncbi:MAG: S-layer homology domain-containing protein, partial [Bacteroidota bacterium]
MKNALWLLPIVVGTIAAPVYAVAPSDVFKDVPAGHWAEKGVEEMAIKRSIMRGYEDFTFRGDLPYTRLQFATSMKELINDIEGIAKASLKLEKPLNNRFSDVQGYDRDVVLPLANEYGLFQNVPGIEPGAFHGDRPMTRYEVARVINNLMRTAEKKDVIRPRKDGKNYEFSDVSQKEAIYREIQTVANHYGVMIGFPDNTFRGKEDLTRYQFAMTGTQMVPLINELVTSTLEQRAAEKRAANFVPLPFHAEIMSGMTGGAVPSSMVPALGFRWVDQPNWFMRNDTRLQFHSGAVAVGNDRSGLMLDERFGAFPVMRFFGLQPYVGARAIGDFYNKTSLMGGVTYGLTGEWHLDPTWAVGANLFESNLLLAQNLGAADPNPRGMFLGGADLELSYALNPKLALTGGLGFWEAPSGYRTGGMTKANVTDLKFGLSWQ